MERVKLTFERSEDGGRVIIRKDGGFTTQDLHKLTEIVEDLYADGGAEDSANEDAELEAMGGDGEDGSSGGSGDKSFLDRVNREAAAAAARQQAPKGPTTPPAGRGQVAAKLPDGTGITKEGDVDRRTLRGSPQNPDPKQQKLAKRIESNRPEAGA